MNTNATYIFLENISFYSYHGVMPQEKIVGNTFIVNLKLKVDFTQASLTDNLNDTISYAEVYNVMKREMDIPSQLLEHVCRRIVQSLFDAFPTIGEITISLKKKNPPMGADIDFSGVEMICTNK